MFCFYFSVQLVVLANGSLSSVHPNPTQLLPVLNVAKVSWQFLLNICIYSIPIMELTGKTRSSQREFHQGLFYKILPKTFG